MTEKEHILKTLKDCVNAMEMQEGRMNEEFHIPALTAKSIWDEAKKQAKTLIHTLEPKEPVIALCDRIQGDCACGDWHNGND